MTLLLYVIKFGVGFVFSILFVAVLLAVLRTEVTRCLRDLMNHDCQLKIIYAREEAKIIRESRPQNNSSPFN